MISKENATIIRALNNFGRVPEAHELLDEIERLKEYSNQLESNYDLMLKNDDNKLLMDYKLIIEKAIEIAKDLKQFIYDELVDRNISGVTEIHLKIINLLDTLNGRSDE